MNFTQINNNCGDVVNVTESKHAQKEIHRRPVDLASYADACNLLAAIKEQVERLGATHAEATWHVTVSRQDLRVSYLTHQNIEEQVAAAIDELLEAEQLAEKGAQE